MTLSEEDGNNNDDPMSSLPGEATPLWLPPAPSSHHRMTSESSIEDIVLQSIHFVEDAIHDIGVEIHDIGVDISTFQPLDEEEVAAEAEELGVIDLSNLDTVEEKEEAIENYIYPDDPFLPNPNKLGVLPLAVIVFYNVSGGPFGAETAVRAGGNLFALLGFIIGPLVWSMQEVSGRVAIRTSNILFYSSNIAVIFIRLSLRRSLEPLFLKQAQVLHGSKKLSGPVLAGCVDI